MSIVRRIEREMEMHIRTNAGILTIPRKKKITSERNGYTELRLPLFYFCEKRFGYYLKNIFKSQRHE